MLRKLITLSLVVATVRCADSDTTVGAGVGIATTPDVASSTDIVAGDGAVSDESDAVSPTDVDVVPDVAPDLDIAVADANAESDAEPTDITPLDDSVSPTDDAAWPVDDALAIDTGAIDDAVDAVASDDVLPLPDVGSPDVDAPVDADADPVDTYVEPTPTLVTAGPGEPVVASATLLGTAVVAAAPVGEAVIAVGEAGVSWVAVGPVQVLAPAPVLATAVHALDADRAFIVTGQGAFVATASALTASPLLASLPAPASDAAVIAGTSPTIWLASGGSLWRWRSGVLETLFAAGFDATDHHLAVDADGALWTAGPTGLYRVTTTAAGADVTVERGDFSASDVAIDGAGRVSVLAGGDLYRLEAGEWSWLRFPSPVTALCARPEIETSFVILSTGEAWFVSGDQAWPVAADVAGCAVDIAGRGLLYGPAGLRRVAVNAPIDVGPTAVTWSADIAPIVNARCAKCHGPTGYAHSLASSAQYQAEIDSVITMVSAGAMPLPPNAPLNAQEIGLLQAWKEGGFVQSP